MDERTGAAVHFYLMLSITNELERNLVQIRTFTPLQVGNMESSWLKKTKRDEEIHGDGGKSGCKMHGVNKTSSAGGVQDHLCLDAHVRVVPIGLMR